MDYLILTKVQGVILGPISRILGWILNVLFKFTNSFGVLNIGLSIILFTLVVKIIMFPLVIKQQKASKLMVIMEPELQTIRKKYKGKRDTDSLRKMDVEIKAVYDKYGASLTGGFFQLLIQLPILLALYRVIYTIPAYVSPVKTYFMNVVYAITGISDVSSLTEGAAADLMQFATNHGVSMKGVNAIGDLTGLTGEVLGNKMVDILYKLNPAQWSELGQAFPNVSAVIAENAAAIEKMNSFFGINLSTNPFNGSYVPNVAWLIPILAGLTQWFSTKLIMANQAQPKNDENSMSSQMMKSMNVTMPMVSVFLCFSFPAAIGIYWVASSVFQILQQMVVNYFLNRVDIDEMVRKNMEKANAKRAKKGLPPQQINQNAAASLKSIQAAAEMKETEKAEKIEKIKKQVEESTNYYNKDAKSGSLTAKANMVAKYNEKHNK